MSGQVLCGACQTFLRGESLYHRRDKCFTHHPSTESFEQALALPCAICVRLWAQVKREYEYLCSEEDFYPSKRHLEEPPKPAPTTYTHPTIRKQDRNTKTRIVDFHIGEDLARLLFEPWEEKPDCFSNPISENTGDDIALEFFISQYKQCRENHTKCQLSTSPSDFLPTRVVDVGVEGDPLIYLRRSKHITSGEPYIALSHCWGNSQPFTLTQATSAELEAGLEMARLSKTFRDAIIVTRKFKLRYLWIDSLCIFQDNLDDWHVEAGHMRDIYSKAALCIAATAAKDGNTGLFLSRDSQGLTPIKVEATWSHKQSVPRFPPAGTYWCGCHWLSTYEAVDDAPLNQRAWVAQERYLSPRILHFSLDVLFWECPEYIASETFQDGIPDIVYTGAGNYDTRLLKTLMNSTRIRQAAAGVVEHSNGVDMFSAADMYRAWCTFRTAYIGSGLTKEKDVLVALSGIAQDVASVTNDEFVAGLWKDRFLEELSWKGYGALLRPGKPYKPSKWRAPSWSWASRLYSVSQSELVRGREKYEHTRNMSTVLSFDIKAMPSGELESASVTLQSNFIPARLHTNNDWVGEVTFADWNDEERSKRGLSIQLDAPSIDGTEGDDHDVLLLLLRHLFNDTNVKAHIEFLVIAPSHAKAGCFERVGVYRAGFSTEEAVEPIVHLIDRYNRAESRVIVLV